MSAPLPAEAVLPFIDRLRSKKPGVPVTWALAVVNLAVFAATLLAGAGWWHTANAVQLDWGANFGPATQDGEWWRLGTAMFLHFGLLHLAVNLVTLAELGRYVERILGPVRFILLYVGSGVGGNLLSLVMQGNHGVSGGASGALFGLCAALLVAVWRERGALGEGEFRWLFLGGLAFTAGNIALGLLVAGIDNGAHLGGFVCGLLLSPILARREAHAPRAPDRIRPAASALLGIWIAALVLALPEARYDWSDELAARAALRQFASTDSALAERWNAILQSGDRQGLSFAEMASRIETEVGLRYEESFEHLAAFDLDPRAPSAALLDRVRHYARLRGAASHEFADALRAGDAQGMQRAFEKLEGAGMRQTEHPQPAGKE